MGVLLFLAPLSAANLILSMDGIQVAKGGDLVILLWPADGGFPKADKAKEKRVVAPVSKLEVVFSNLAPGDYAAAVIHDLNRNGRMDFRFPFIPIEGSAFTGGRPGWGPPSFKTHHFSVTEPVVKQAVTLAY